MTPEWDYNLASMNDGKVEKKLAQFGGGMESSAAETRSLSRLMAVRLW